MELELLSRQELQGIPSASGIEIIDTAVYAIGDNSAFLYLLDKKYEVKDKIQIASLKNAVDGIIPKAMKPDYEAMTGAVTGKEKVLLVFGSGSKSPERDSLAIVNIKTKKATHYSLTSFYEAIRSSAKLTIEQFNLEAAAVSGSTLYLFNRGNNTIIGCALNDLLAHLQKKEKCPSLTIYRIKLPLSGKLQAGFSGATVIQNKIVFTASVENTANWIDDGEIKGSYVGIINLDELKDDYASACIPVSDKEKILNVKVESISVLAHSNNDLELLLVTDSDGGASEIIKVRMIL